VIEAWPSPPTPSAPQRASCTSAPSIRWRSSASGRRSLKPVSTACSAGTSWASGFNLEIVIKMGAGAFVCGEETALIHSVEGKRGMPRPRPPFPAVSGLKRQAHHYQQRRDACEPAGHRRQRPGVVRGHRHRHQQGTKVFALSGMVEADGLVEVAMGTTLRQNSVRHRRRSGPTERNTKPPRSAAFRRCIPAEHLDVQIDYESLGNLGAIMGSGGLVIMDEATCMVDLAKYFMDFIQRKAAASASHARGHAANAGNPPAHHPRPRQRERSRRPGTIQGRHVLNRLAEAIKRRQLVRPGADRPNPVLSTLRWFRDEYEAHIFERRCPAGVRRIASIPHRRRGMQGLHAVREEVPRRRHPRRGQEPALYRGPKSA